MTFEDSSTKVMETIGGICFEKPIIEIEHSSLTRVSEESAYRSVCPVCLHGTLLVRRNEDMRLSNNDNCILCGQRYRYTDLKGLSPVETPID